MSKSKTALIRATVHDVEDVKHPTLAQLNAAVEDAIDELYTELNAEHDVDVNATAEWTD